MIPPGGMEKEEEREENLRWYQAFFQSTGDMIFVHPILENGLPGPILEVNPAACRVLGYEKEEILGRTIRDFLPPERWKRARPVTRKVLEKGSALFDSVLVSREGERIPVEVHAVILRSKEGENLFLSVARDLRPWEETQRKVRENQKFLEDVFEAIQDGICVLDMDMTVLRVNRWMERMYGFQGELRGKKCYQVYHDRKEICPWCPTVKTMASAKPHCSVVPYPYLEGGTGWMELSAYPLLDDQGRVKGVIEHVKDITERKRAEEDRDRLLTALEQSGEILALTDPRGVIQYVNRAFEKVTGFSREEALGKTFRLVRSGAHDRAFYEHLWKALLAGKSWEGKLKNRRKDGRLYFEQAVISPFKDKDGKILGFAKAARDVTKEMAMEERLRQAQRLEAVGTLAGGIAHDFNNLLLAILGNLDMALLAEKEKRNAFLEEAKKAAARAGELTRQLLAFSRRQIMRPQDLDLNQVIGNLLLMLRRLLPDGIEVDFIPAHSPGTIHADPVQMEQVCMNLVLNARDAMPRGGKITIETENVVINGDFSRNHPWARQGRYLLLSVTDTGEGIPPEVLDRVFEPFFSTKEVGSGTGLGLAMVYGIVEQHGGMIHAYSEVGKGSTFKVYLPIVERPAAVVGTKLQGPVPGGKETILLAEDDPAVRDLVSRVLETAGYKVLRARDGEEALQVYRSHRAEVDMALLDVVMPGMTGTKLARELRSLAPGLPLLLMSGYPSRAVEDEMQREDEKNLLSKPFDGETLLRKVREILKQRT